MSRRRIGALLAVLLSLAICAGSTASADAAPPKVLAKSWALVDGRTGEVLLSHAGDERRLIASTTKLMTAYVAMKDLPLGKVVVAQPYEYEYGESVMGLQAGERISVHDLLYGLILLSAGDAAHTLAVDAAGSQKKFVAQMNRYAAALGLTNTHYANPVGLDEKGNYSSALDLAALTEQLEKIPAFAKIADAREATLRSTRPVRHIESINELLEMAPWVTGVKTGHTWKAGYVLVGSGERHGIDLVAVAIDAPTDETRFSDCLELLEWGFRQYHRRKAVRKGKELANPSIRYSGGELPLRVARSLKIPLRSDQKVDVQVDAPGEVTGPIRRGAKLGTATVSVDGLRAGTVALVASRSVPAASSFDRVRGFVSENPIPLGFAVGVILIVLTFLGWSVRRARKRKRVMS